MTIRSVARAAACIMLALCAAFAFGGCRDSDTFKEIVYDQTSETVDTDNPDKIYINDTSSDITTDALPAVENDKDAPITDEKQSLVVYGSSPNTKDMETKQSLYDANPDFNGIEASNTVSFYYSSDENVSDHEAPHESKDPQDAEDVQYSSFTDGDVDPDDPPKGSEGSDNESDDKGSEQSKNAKEADPKDSSNGGSDDGDFDSVYDTADPNQKPPKVEKMAAFGDYATIVAMVGGKGALAATDAKTLNSRFKNVFDCSGVKTGWSSDGKMDVSAIIKSGADAVLLQAQPSASDAKKLKAAKVNVTLIGELATSQQIKDTVKTIAEMLSDSTTIQYKGKTQDRASDYITFHDRVVKNASNANGGLAQAGNCGQLQKSSAKDKANTSFSSASATYTALVVEYDQSARYVGESYDSWKISDPGLAFGNSGCDSSPVAYYIQAGGLVDNPSYVTKSETGGGLAPLWQYRSFPFRKNEWTGSSIDKVSSSLVKTLIEDNTLTLSTKENVYDAIQIGDSFGTSTFPKLIAKSTSIKQGIMSNSAKLNSAMHPFGFDTSSIITHIGPNGSIYSCIGFSQSTTGSNPLGNSIPDSSIEVQPTGLFSDWTEGTVESFLESAWVNDVVKGNSNQVNWMQEVQDFYAKFYGYNLTSSDWTTIRSGA